MLEAAAIGIDFQQLGVNRRTLRILLQGFEKNFFSLGITTVGHVNIGLSNRIDFIGVDRTRTGLAEIASLRRGIAGIDALPTGHAEYRVRTQTGGHRRRSRFQGCSLRAAALEREIGSQQGQDAAPGSQRQRVFHQGIDKARFLDWQRWGHNRLRGLDLCRLYRLCRFNGFGLFGKLGRLDGLGRLINLGLCFRRLDRFHCLNRLGLLLLGRLLQFSQFLVLHLQEFLEFIDILFKDSQALLCILERLLPGNLFGGFGGLGIRRTLRCSIGTSDLHLIFRLLGRHEFFFDLRRNLAGTGLSASFISLRRSFAR